MAQKLSNKGYLTEYIGTMKIYIKIEFPQEEHDERMIFIANKGNAIQIYPYRLRYPTSVARPPKPITKMIHFTEDVDKMEMMVEGLFSKGEVKCDPERITLEGVKGNKALICCMEEDYGCSIDTGEAELAEKAIVAYNLGWKKHRVRLQNYKSMETLHKDKERVERKMMRFCKISACKEFKLFY